MKKREAQLPEGWEVKKLGEVCTIKPPKKEAKLKVRDDEFVSFLPMKDLGVLEKEINPVKERLFKEVSGNYTYFANRDVLLAKITPCFENGKLGIARNLTNGIGFGSSEYIVFRGKGQIAEEYLFYFLSQEQFREEGKDRMTGAVGHKRVSKEFIENYKIPLPPLSEQKRIVSILDRAFAAIDQAIANAGKNLQNAGELFESYLQGVFEEGDWEWKTLNEIAENLDRKRIPIAKNKRTAGEIPYYGASGIVDYVDDYIFDEDLLCISEDGANLLARTYPIAFSISGKTWVNNHAHVLRFQNFTSQKFIEYYINSISIDDYVTGMAQPKLNQRNLNRISAPFPPLEEQRKILDKINGIQSQTQILETLYQNKITALEELKKSILAKAFDGELATEKVEMV